MIKQDDAPLGYVAIAHLGGRGSCVGCVFDTPILTCNLVLFGGSVG